MKKTLVLISIIVAAFFTKTSAQSDTQANAKIVLIRDAELRGWAFTFPVFLNENYVEKLPFRTTSTLVVPAGENTLSFRYVGKKNPWKHAEKLTLNLQPDETKYVMVTQLQIPFRTVIRPLEVTEATAKKFTQPVNFTVEVTQNN